jgi:pyruvate formate lyase activating enzyme
MTPVLEFLSLLDKKGILTWIRQVIIPSVNDTEKNICSLKEIVSAYKCIEKVELLPFRKICQTKYDQMGIEFPFGKMDEPTREKMQELNSLL